MISYIENFQKETLEMKMKNNNLNTTLSSEDFIPV